MFRCLPLRNNSYKTLCVMSCGCLFPFLVLRASTTFLFPAMYLPARLIVPALAVLLTACAQTQHKPVAVFSPAAEAELEQIRSAFNEGDYSTVIRQVGRSSTLPAAAPNQYSEALKLQAFSFCVRDYTFLCEERFKQARAVDPGFTLAQAERGHPTWGPVYEKVAGAQP